MAFTFDRRIRDFLRQVMNWPKGMDDEHVIAIIESCERFTQRAVSCGAVKDDERSRHHFKIHRVLDEMREWKAA